MRAGGIPEIFRLRWDDIGLAQDGIATVHALITGFVVAIAGTEEHAAAGYAPTLATADIDHLRRCRMAASGEEDKGGKARYPSGFDRH